MFYTQKPEGDVTVYTFYGAVRVYEKSMFVERGQVALFFLDPRPPLEGFPVEIKLGGVFFGAVQIRFVVEDSHLIVSDLN